MAGTGRGAAAELWGVLLPPRRAAEGSEDEEDEEVEEEPHLAEAALLEASGRDLTAALPPRRAGEGKRERERGAAGPGPLRCPGARSAGRRSGGPCSGMAAVGSQRRQPCCLGRTLSLLLSVI